MPYNKEQLQAYWQANKEFLNQKRRQKRRLAKLGLATEQVSNNSSGEVSQIEQKPVSHLEVSQFIPKKVSHKLSEFSPPAKTANPLLTSLIQKWQTQTNYSCPPTCFYSYCSNCWFFAENELIDYKEVGM